MSQRRSLRRYVKTLVKASWARKWAVSRVCAVRNIIAPFRSDRAPFSDYVCRPASTGQFHHSDTHAEDVYGSPTLNTYQTIDARSHFTAAPSIQYHFCWCQRSREKHQSLESLLLAHPEWIPRAHRRLRYLPVRINYIRIPDVSLTSHTGVVPSNNFECMSATSGCSGLMEQPTAKVASSSTNVATGKMPPGSPRKLSPTVR